jgi:hypothetical protein
MTITFIVNRDTDLNHPVRIESPAIDPPPSEKDIPRRRYSDALTQLQKFFGETTTVAASCIASRTSSQSNFVKKY